MPSYEWTCLACGHVNKAQIETCVTCACPASATFEQIASFRSEYVAKGGPVLPGAAKLPEQGDAEILGVFAKLTLRMVEAIYGGRLK